MRRKMEIIGINSKDKDQRVEFESIREASRQLNMYHTTIIASCNRMKDLTEPLYFNKYGWLFYYKTDKWLAEVRINGEGIMTHYSRKLLLE